MTKFKPIKKHGTGLERWKDEKTGKEWRKMGLLIQRKIGKSGKTHSKKEKKREKNWKEKELFLNGNAFLSVPVPTNFDQRTSLAGTQQRVAPLELWQIVPYITDLPSRTCRS